MRLNDMRIFALAVCCALSAAAVRADEENSAPAAPPLPSEAVRLAEVYRVEAAKIAAQQAESVKALPAAYQIQLAALQKKLQESGDLDGYLGVAKEMKRFAAALTGEADPFEKVPEMPEGALVSKPESLRALQDQYLRAYKEKSDRRHKQLEELTNTLIAQLENVQKDMTIKGRIRDAIAVKREVERLRKGVADDTFVQQALALVSEQPRSSRSSTNAPAAPVDSIPTYGRVPDWAKWEFDHDGNFCSEGYLFRHPDLPDELNMAFDARLGRGRVDGRCDVERQVVEMRERSWFGKALQWKVKDYSNLNATIVLQSKEIAAGREYGPVVNLVLLGEKGQLGEGLDVTIMWHEITLTIAKDPDSGKCTLGWTQGKIKKVVDLPPSGAVRVLLGIAVRNPGERCDTTITMR